MKKQALKRALLIDTETSSLEPPPRGVAVEVAVTLFDLEYAQPITSFASLIRSSRNDAVEVNRIPIGMLRVAEAPEEVWLVVEAMAERAQVVIAHNAEFDRQFVPDLGKPWVCSANDIEWPVRLESKSLASIALSLGLGVASAHRAASDVDTLSRILTRTAELSESDIDLVERVERAMRPQRMCYAQVSYDDREIAKQFGFRWDAEKKQWWRRVFVDEIEKLPFKVITPKEPR